MKSIRTFYLLVILLTAGSLYPQNQKAGIKAGINLSSVSFDENTVFFEDVKNHTGFQIFGSYDVYKDKLLTISAETGYILKGFENSLVSTNALGEITGTTVVKNKMNFIDVAANLKFIYRSGISPFLTIIPAAGVYIGGSSSSSGNNSSDSINLLFDILLDSLNTFTFGFKFGAGAEFNNIIKNVPLTAEIRYDPDLTYVYDKNSFRLKNKVLEFNIGIKF